MIMELANSCGLSFRSTTVSPAMGFDPATSLVEFKNQLNFQSTRLRRGHQPMLRHGNVTDHAPSVNIPRSREPSLKPTWPDSRSRPGVPSVKPGDEKSSWTSTSLTTTQA